MNVNNHGTSRDISEEILSVSSGEISIEQTKITILIVDDQPDNLRTLASILGSQGYKVRKALSGEMALLTVRAERPDLILLDIKMPEIDGYQVCATLKNSVETSAIPIIFLSALDDIADKVKAFEVGGSDYITKPFQAEEVLVRIGNQLTIWEQQRQLNEHNYRLKQEIYERQQAEAETQLLLTTIQAVSQAADFDAALQVALRAVRRAIAWDYGEAWIVSDDGRYLQIRQAEYNWRDEKLKQFYEVSAKLTFAAARGLPGRVWASRQSEWLEDVSQNSELMLPRTEAMSIVQLKAVFGIPITLGEQVMAVLVFFKRGKSLYDHRLMRLISAVALELGSLMQRIRTEEALRVANQELERLANLDGLTQVANRRCFDRLLQQEWSRLQRESAPLSLLLCDVDYFKKYNDCYGHQAGDECLKQVAQSIQSVLKRPADVLARYGGEEFVILLPNTDLQGAIYVAQQIQLAIASLKIPHAPSTSADSFVSLSIGISSMVPHQDSFPEQLISRADQSLYQAKAQGRNTIRVNDVEF